ncbi:hypothetical protein E2C01_042537 [Portunus trituberculatus]|uniref:Uncharacterized protein n=1 Tax=Portunus trituberculatus TaxID=210409 RepID=A0A5B7FWS0_PORTR|nr:hypothetical protein [Portunus trituberculatus]
MEGLQTPSSSPSDTTALQQVTEGKKSERGSPSKLETTDIVAEDIDLEPVMEEGLGSTDGRVERLRHTVTQP